MMQRANGMPWLSADPTVDYTAVTTVEVAVESDTIAQLKVKLNDAQEYDLDLTADGPQTLTLTVTTPLTQQQNRLSSSS